MGFDFNPLIWFACGYCKQHCTNLKNLKRHKLQSHLGECLKVKCIIFEEKCLEEEWKPGDSLHPQRDRGGRSIPCLKRKKITQKSHYSVNISSQGKGFMNPYVSLPQLASPELSSGTGDFKFIPDLNKSVCEAEPGHSSSRQRCRPSERKRSAQHSLMGPGEGKLLVSNSNSKQFKFDNADTTQQNQNDSTECKNEAIISFDSNSVKYEDDVNSLSPAVHSEIDTDVAEIEGTANLDMGSTKEPLGQVQPKTNSAEGEQMDMNEFIDCQLGLSSSASASASPSSSISDESEKPHASSDTEVTELIKSSSPAVKITGKYTTRRNKPKINYSENHPCNHCSEEYNTFAELANHQIFCKPRAISPRKSRMKVPKKMYKVPHEDEVLISDSDNDKDGSSHNEIQDTQSTEIKSKIISKKNNGEENKGRSCDSDDNFKLSDEAESSSVEDDNDNEVSHLDDVTDEDDSDEDYIITPRLSHRRRPRLQKQPREKTIRKRTKDNSNYSKDPKTRFKCKVCGKEFKIRRNCEYHEQCHENPEKANPFKCNLCDLAFRFQNILDNHIKTHSSHRDYKCEECGLSWRNKTSLERHQAVHGVVLTFKCNFCEKSFINRGKLESHERTHTGDRPFKCSVENCDCAFHSQSALAAHLRLKHGEELGMEKYLCPQCGKTFWVPSHLTYHIRRFHTDKKDKPFKCSKEGCTKTFSMKIQLKRHLALHNGEKPFICDQCGMAFAYGTSLKKHQLRHVNEQDEDNQVKVVPTCHLCSKTFVKNSKLTRHMKSHKEGENLKYQCEFCEVKVITKSLLTKHLKIDHGFEFGKGQNPLGVSGGDGHGGDINSGSDSEDAASGNEGGNCIINSAANILANS